MNLASRKGVFDQRNGLKTKGQLRNLLKRSLEGEAMLIRAFSYLNWWKERNEKVKIKL